MKFLQKYSSTDAALLMELYRHCSNTLRLVYLDNAVTHIDLPNSNYLYSGASPKDQAQAELFFTLKIFPEIQPPR